VSDESQNEIQSANEIVVAQSFGVTVEERPMAGLATTIMGVEVGRLRQQKRKNTHLWNSREFSAARAESLRSETGHGSQHGFGGRDSESIEIPERARPKELGP
jgi:hypothetical protein